MSASGAMRTGFLAQNWLRMDPMLDERIVAKVGFSWDNENGLFSELSGRSMGDSQLKRCCHPMHCDYHV
jgi:hypothetical protein